MTRATDAEPATSAERTLRLLLVAAILLPILVLCGAGFLSLRSHFKEAEERLGRSVDVVYEHAVKVFETLELVASQVDQLLSSSTDPEIRAREKDIHARLAALSRRLDQVQFVWATDGADNLLVSSIASPVPPNINYADRDYVRAARAGAPGQIYVGELVTGRLQQADTFFTVNTRRGRASDSETAAASPFEGVVAISANPRYFSEFYQQLVRGGLDTVTLLRADGALLARYPTDKIDVSTRAPATSPLMQAIARAPERGSYEAVSVVDGIRRIYAYRRLPHLPVYVTTGLDRATVLASWRSVMASHLLFGVPATGGLVLLVLAALRHTGREREIARELSERTRERDRTWSNSQDLLAVVDVAGIFREANPAWTRILGWRPDEIVGRDHLDLVHPDDRDLGLQTIAQQERERSAGHECRCRHKDGSYRWISWVAAPDGDLIYASGRDVTAEKAASADLAGAQEQLRQAQKMEAVGQLTGGIAHDFNNMLAIVIGSLDLLKRRLGEGETRHLRLVANALEGANRAAALTGRLLAFSRQQALAPEAIDANTLVAGMSELLRRTLTGSVRLETVMAEDLWRCHADPNQLENALLNLAVNARDAMPEGGRLTLETANCHFDDAYASEHLGVPSGHYVMVAVSDTGSGMSPDIAARAFDPFFSTKPVGKGTGLGLSMVYGFVRQSGGHVKIYSEPGLGTTIKIYLPRHVGAAAPGDAGPADRPSSPPLLRGDGRATVLVVEDEPGVRRLSVEGLNELGYRVCEADGAAEALRLLDLHPEIDLLFTDVVMPETNGAKLAEEARRRRPDLKVLFTTGYTRNAVLHNGTVEPGVHLLGKPFTLEQLARKVAEVLAAAEGGSSDPG